jgi:hypothetical protein
MLDTGSLYRRFDEDAQGDMRLGRHLWLDSRSLGYMVENQVSAMAAPLKNQNWDRVIPILDQGSLGSCTGNAGAGALGTQPFYDKVGQRTLGDTKDSKVLEDFAVRLYSDATKVDPYPGSYLPTDTGSSGLAVCKVLAKRGTISGYTWARTAYGFLRLLQNGPVLVGMPWYQAFYYPDRTGFIDSNRNWASSGLAGGHEVEAIGVELDTRDVFNSTIIYVNSWSENWGDAGRFKMRLRTYEQLSWVDLKQPVIS